MFKVCGSFRTKPNLNVFTLLFSLLKTTSNYCFLSTKNSHEIKSHLKKNKKLEILQCQHIYLCTDLFKMRWLICLTLLAAFTRTTSYKENLKFKDVKIFLLLDSWIQPQWHNANPPVKEGFCQWPVWKPRNMFLLFTT